MLSRVPWLFWLLSDEGPPSDPVEPVLAGGFWVCQGMYRESSQPILMNILIMTVYRYGLVGYAVV